MSRSGTTRSDRLVRRMREHARVVVVTHDNPDPDAIASGWAIHRLATRLERPVRFVAGGAVIRAENRQMIRLLQPPLELLDDVAADDETLYVFVDCAPEASNHVLAGGLPGRVAVLDHHQQSAPQRRALHRDVRQSAAATASIAAQYLHDQDIEPDARLATALMYAIRTETSGSAFTHSRLDRSAINWLTPFAQPDLLAAIANAPLSPAYYGDLTLALQNSEVYGDVALCLLPRASSAEMVGEVADLLIRCEGVTRVLCGAAVGAELLCSVRTWGPRYNAAELVQRTLEGLGRGGGHDNRAGGKVQLDRNVARVPEALAEDIRARWLAVCGATGARASRLVPSATPE